MESNGVSRAPLTRSRRRISLEQVEEVKTSVTPTKKKGRAAAKPQLDDIDENTLINSPRKSRRNSVKDLFDVVKSDTPTSALTPARRSSRIISNTSITNENTQNFESPRALRASRRLSRTGSDADTPTLTPTKTLRRTRRSITNTDSSSESSNPVSQQLIIKIIPEETELLNTSTNTNNKEKVRKSPRLLGKTNPEKCKYVEQNNDDNIPDKAETQSSDLTTNQTVQGSPKHQQNKALNNTVPCYVSDKRNRTDSLNISRRSEDISIPSFFSDNEGGKVKKVKKSKKSLVANEKENIHNQDHIDACFISHSLNTNNEDLISMTRINKNKTQIVIEHAKDNLHPKADFIEDSNSCSRDKAATTSQESGDQCVPEVEPLAEGKDILEQKSSTTLSSNTGPIGFMSKLVRTTTDLSCEPMDIDETIPENVTVLDYSNDNIESPIKTKPDNQEKETFNTSQNVTKRKLSITNEQSMDTPIKISTQNILGLQTSTPVDNQPKLSKNKLRNVPETSDDYDTDIQPKHVKKGKKAKLLESDDSSDESDDTNKLVIEEAEEIPDDYESGDSMDEEERNYLKENEIVEKGESIGFDTTDYSSDESDYDKDSFVASSNEEDNELLSGSGDDLSMSDNELSMSKKSKAKYDKRKLKEQKQASREMYEARHGMINNESESSLVSKKDKNLSSSSQDQEDQEISVIKCIGHNRMRINSEVTETEISAIVNDSIMDKQDPLEKAIKVEPKTPYNSFNISIANIQPNVEHLEIDENATLMKSNTTKDPLENMSDDDDSSLCSENEEIKDDYDSLLSNLNKDKTNNPKMILKIQDNDKNIDGNEVRDSDTSDSIDIKLLFPENGESDSSNEKSNNKKELLSSDENFIPLKRVEGKTNMRKSEEAITGSVAKDKVTKKNKQLSETMPIQFDRDTSQLLKPKKDKMLSQSLTQAEHSTNQFLNAKKTKTTSESSMTNQSENDANHLLNTKKKKKTSSETSITNQSESDANQSLNSKKKKTSSTSMTNQSESDANKLLSTKKKNSSSESSVINPSEIVANQSLNSKKKETLDSSMTNQSKSDANQSLNSNKTKISSESSMTNQSESDANQSLNTKKKKKTSSETSITDQSESDANQSLNFKKKKTSSEFSMTQTEQNAHQSLISIKNKTFSESSLTDQIEPGSNKSFNSKQNRSIVKSSLTSQTENGANQSIESKKEKKSSESSIIQEERDLNQSFKTKKNVTNQSGNRTKQTLNIDKKEEKIKKTKHILPSEISSDAKENDDLNKSNGMLHQSNQNTDPKLNIKKNNPGKGRKRKISDSLLESSNIKKTDQDEPMNSKKKKKQTQSDVLKENTNFSAIIVRKRKQRPEGDNRKNKIMSGFLNTLPVPRLPTTVLDQLDKKAKTTVHSTTQFSVDITTKRKMKPSEYMEDSVYLNLQSPEKKRRKKLHTNPKVLPFVPTVCTSGSGFTTRFQISIVPKVVEFVAQPSIASNFKMDKIKNTKQAASKYKPRKKTANLRKY